jgi:hypothetical protein
VRDGKMAMPKRKILIVCAIGIFLLLTASLISEFWDRRHPERAFKRDTRWSLPLQVRVLNYQWKFCDNLFRTCSYWKLEVPEGTFEQLFHVSDADTNFDGFEMWRSEVLKTVDPSILPSDVPEGYRLRWPDKPTHFVFRHKNRTTCYYFISSM